MSRTHHDIFIEIDAIASVMPYEGILDKITKLAAEGMQLVAPLTPAEQHAEEMLALLKDVNDKRGFYAARIAAVIDKIEPPPPTLDEALRALAAIDCTGMHPDIGAIVTRARASGLL